MREYIGSLSFSYYIRPNNTICSLLLLPGLLWILSVPQLNGSQKMVKVWMLYDIPKDDPVVHACIADMRETEVTSSNIYLSIYPSSSSLF